MPPAGEELTLNLDAQGLESALKAFNDLLAAEAAQQNAYLFRFPDGRISLELEWLDIGAVARAVIAAYIAAAAEGRESQAGTSG
jgi:hypothetical protein